MEDRVCGKVASAFNSWVSAFTAVFHGNEKTVAAFELALDPSSSLSLATFKLQDSFAEHLPSHPDTFDDEHSTMWSNRLLDELLAPIDTITFDPAPRRLLISQMRLLAPWLSSITLLEAAWPRLLFPTLISDETLEQNVKTSWSEAAECVSDLVLDSVKSLRDEHAKLIINIVFESYCKEHDRVIALEDRAESDPMNVLRKLWQSNGTTRMVQLIIDLACIRPKVIFECSSSWIIHPNQRLFGLSIISKFAAHESSSALMHLVFETRLIDSVLFVTSFETSTPVVVIALSLLTCLFPYMLPHMTSVYLDSLLSVLVRCIRWEPLTCISLKLAASNVELFHHNSSQEQQTLTSFDLEMDELDDDNATPWGSGSLMKPSALDSSEITEFQVSSDPSIALSHYSVAYIRRTINHLFTHIYGIFPVSLLDRLRTLRSKINEGARVEDDRFWDALTIKKGEKFLPCVDVLSRLRRRVVELDIVDLSNLVCRRVEILLRAHRQNPSITFYTASEELEHARSISKHVSVITSDCMSLRVRSARPSINLDAQAIDSSLSMILAANFRLREILMETPVNRMNNTQHQINMNRPVLQIDVLKIHLFLLLNELNTELVLRARQSQLIDILRSSHISREVNAAGHESMVQKLRQQQQEIGSLISIVEQLRSEAGATRERHRRYEEDLAKRVRSLRDAARVASAECERLKIELLQRSEHEKNLQRQLDMRNQKISLLEQEVLHLSPKAALLSEYSAVNSSLKEQFFSRNDESFLNAQSRLASLELQLEAAKAELSKQTENKIAISSIDRLESLVAEQAKTIQELRAEISLVRDSSCRKIDAMEEKCQTLRNIQIALQAKLLITNHVPM